MSSRFWAVVFGAACLGILAVALLFVVAPVGPCYAIQAVGIVLSMGVALVALEKTVTR